MLPLMEQRVSHLLTNHVSTSPFKKRKRDHSPSFLKNKIKKAEEEYDAHRRPPPQPPWAMAVNTPFAHRLRLRSSTRLASLLIATSSLALLIFFSLRAAVDNLASQTRTLAGHNLDPTPWHPFNKENNSSSSSAIFRCSYLSCRRIIPYSSPRPLLKQRQKPRSCPAYFGSIHRDLEPWRRSRISAALLAEAQKYAAMRVLIVGGRLYVDLYYACVQSRAMFTIWGLLQLLRRYPGAVPDVDIMFDCMDRPTIERSVYNGCSNSTDGVSMAPPLFRYCTTKGHLDIPFPDWSFWGWPEIMIKPWEEELRSIKRGSQAKTWEMKDPTAYWKGNPDVQSSIRVALLECNDAKKWGAQIIRQNWAEEVNSGFKNSALSSQCNHRYKIYAEGFAWSVSLKYILSCGSLTLVIDPLYEDFFTRGLKPRVNYWPINATDLCRSIKYTVDWGNKHPTVAKAIGKKGQELMEELDMDHVYDYMYHLILEYSKLQDFKPVPPLSAQEACPESILCLADENQRELLERSYSSPASYVPCTLPQP